MPKHAPNTDSSPESLSAVWRAVHSLGKGFEALEVIVNKPGFWAIFWKERSWSIATTLVVLGFLASGLWYVGGLIFDRHIESALGPVHTQLSTIQGNIEQINGTLGVLQAQIIAQKYSAVPLKELKAHGEELKQLKANLAQ